MSPSCKLGIPFPSTPTFFLLVTHKVGFSFRPILKTGASSVSSIGSTSSRAGLGYLEEDSAGQQNIFSVEPKVYVQGSATDEARGGGSLIYSAVALAASGALVYIGLGALGGDSPTESIPRGKPLSVFLREFGEETNTPYFGMPEAVKAAPAPAVVEEVAATEE